VPSAVVDDSAESTVVPVKISSTTDDFDFLDAVDIIGKIPGTLGFTLFTMEMFSANFDEQIQSKKWTERKEVLDSVVSLIEANPKLDPKANYGSFVDTLTQTMAKDANIQVVGSACKCLTLVVNGLRTKFAYTQTVMPVVLDKLKEKKPVVLNETRALLDALAKTGSLEPCIEDIVGVFDKPSPAVRIQTAQFLQRYFNDQLASAVNKKIVKSVVPPLLKVSLHASLEAYLHPVARRPRCRVPRRRRTGAWRCYGCYRREGSTVHVRRRAK
jgi:cytoskeleton-associated protein 5